MPGPVPGRGHTLPPAGGPVGADPVLWGRMTALSVLAAWLTAPLLSRAHALDPGSSARPVPGPGALAGAVPAARRSEPITALQPLPVSARRRGAGGGWLCGGRWQAGWVLCGSGLGQEPGLNIRPESQSPPFSRPRCPWGGAPATRVVGEVSHDLPAEQSPGRGPRPHGGNAGCSCLWVVCVHDSATATSPSDPAFHPSRSSEHREGNPSDAKPLGLRSCTVCLALGHPSSETPKAGGFWVMPNLAVSLWH